MEFYNSEGITGSIIHGITLSMEEEKASGLPLAGEVITSIKTALMGPIAGIGDTLIHGTLKPIFLGIACTFALEGNAIGAFIPFLIPILCLHEFRLSTWPNIGYEIDEIGHCTAYYHGRRYSRLDDDGRIRQFLCENFNAVTVDLK